MQEVCLLEWRSIEVDSKECWNCNSFPFDSDIEAELFHCFKGHFHYTLGYNGVYYGVYVSIEKMPCKGKEYEPNKNKK